MESDTDPPPATALLLECAISRNREFVKSACPQQRCFQRKQAQTAIQRVRADHRKMRKWRDREEERGNSLYGIVHVE